MISIHYPANRKWESDSNLSGRRCVILISHEILVTTLQGNVKQLHVEGTVNNQSLGIERLTVENNFGSHCQSIVLENFYTQLEAKRNEKQSLSCHMLFPALQTVWIIGNEFSKELICITLIIASVLVLQHSSEKRRRLLTLWPLKESD